MIKRIFGNVNLRKSYNYDKQIQAVPEGLEILQFQIPDFQDFLDQIVHDEESKGKLDPWKQSKIVFI